MKAFIFAFCSALALASASIALADNSGPKELDAVNAVLTHNPTVRSVVGPNFDLVRIEPVGYQPQQVVVEVASRDRTTGLSVLLDMATSRVVNTQRLNPSQILFTADDVALAFNLVRNEPVVRTRLGATLPLYQATNSNAVFQPYRVVGLVVRSTAAKDPCMVHRCLQLFFHSPRGFVDGLSLLVDLTASRMLAPTSHTGSAANRAHTLASVRRAITPTQASNTLTIHCHVIRFSTVSSFWKVCWHYALGHGLVVGPASYAGGSGMRSLTIICDARIDEIFVPYASGSPRFFDTSFDFPLATLTQALCLKGTLLDGGQACLEQRDRDIDWLAPLNDPPPGRRGEEAVIWDVLYAANYLYIMQWGFRDDGTFWGRVGATGQNLPGIELESHAHDYFWRIVPHFAGKGNSLNYVRVDEPLNDVVAPDVTNPLTHPASIVWGPQRFDAVDVYAPGVTNGRGDLTSYRLIPMPTGGLAHHNEPFTHADLWVTTANPLELDASQLPSYVHEHASLVNTDVALWYRGSFRHQPRDEDGYYDNTGTWIGTTHTIWTGFLFMPRNLFDRSPFF